MSLTVLMRQKCGSIGGFPMRFIRVEGDKIQVRSGLIFINQRPDAGQGRAITNAPLLQHQ
jgi:hypothetical protein